MSTRGARRLVGLFAAAWVAATLAPSGVRAQAVGFKLTLGANQNFSWTAAVDPSTPTAKVSYFLLRRGGIVDPLAGGTTIAFVFDTTSINFLSKYPGTGCYVVKSSNVVSGVFGLSDTVCHSYMHDTSNGNDGGVERSDANGTQVGFNSQWQFKYFLDQDSFVTAKVYQSTVPFTTSATDGMPNLTDPNTKALKVVLSSAPRTGELFNGSASNTDFWDSRDSSGVLVTNGIYKIHWIVQDVNATIVHRMLTTVPVDVLRITAFTTTGIAASGGNATITYNITAAASVRVLIAKPGRRLVLDANGDIQSLNAAGTAIDTSSTSVVNVINFNRAAGSNTETWNGTDTQGVAVSSGVYVVGISAKDSFGNQAAGTGGTEEAVQGTIPVDRTASQTATDNTPPTVASAKVGTTQVSLTGGTTVSAFTSIEFTLNETAGTGSNISVVTLTGPGGAVGGGNVTASGNTVTYSTATTQSSSGTYTTTITAKDSFGNQSSAVTVNFTIPAPVLPTVSTVAVNGTSINLAGGSSISPGWTSIAFTLSVAAGASASTGPISVTSGAFNLGGSISAAGNVVTWSTNTAVQAPGSYLITITPIDSLGTTGAPVTVSFNVAASGGGGSGSTMTQDAFRASVVPFPNPTASGPMRINFTVANNATVDFDLYTLSGSRVFHQTQSYTSGAQTFNWNLVNQSGSPVATGVYMLRITANDGQNVLRATKKVMILR
ncbi:MAG: T9SS type A sorting domain-containing protein [Elusimicrobia bacterium]|nr:T9SS type A sorting domain-containing protein [Elusimicrobiota bacterium]